MPKHPFEKGLRASFAGLRGDHDSGELNSVPPRRVCSGSATRDRKEKQVGYSKDTIVIVSAGTQAQAGPKTPLRV
jgi:hypothetical protein